MSLVRRAAHPLIATAFVANGVETLIEPGPHIQRARDAGIDALPFGDAATITRTTAAVQVGAGAMLATNRLPRLSALALAATLIPSTYAGHPFWSETDKQTRRHQRSHFVKNLALFGGLLITAADTGGRESLPHKARRKAARS